LVKINEKAKRLTKESLVCKLYSENDLKKWVKTEGVSGGENGNDKSGDKMRRLVQPEADRCR